ncbi:hypothetical protein JSE7799_02538 [Jannaschia seosinensis]|uniref:Uncharacterized protein n=1 Tax=Jannaschia seosinensis TaxID=313367 RepID=A0A0M7BAP6_9RHOB|nr:hypothetical protein JSE7799_02538 [Jannaschia seosinensis]
MAPAALLLQMGVERVPGCDPRDRHHEVAAGIADQPFRVALVVALSGPPVAVAEQVMRQEPAEERGPLTRPVRQDLRNQTAVVVVEDRCGHLAKEREGVDVAINPGFRCRRGISAHKAGIAVRQVHDEEMRLLLDAVDDDHRLAKVGLGMTGRMRQRHEHLSAAPLALPHVVLHDRIAAGETMLIAEPFEQPLRRVPLLAMDLAIAIQPAVDDPGEPVQLRPLHGRRSPVSWRNRERQHLLNAVARNPEVMRRRPLAHALRTGQSHLTIQVHGENPPALPAAREGKGGRLLRRPQQAHPAATVADFCTAVLSWSSSVSYRPASW